MTHDDSDEISITFASGLDDYTALIRYLSWSPTRIALQAAVFLGIGLYLILLAVALGVTSAFVSASSGPFAAAADYLRLEARADLAPIAPWIAALCVGVFLLNLFVLVPRQCRLLARRGLSGYPDIRRDDPTMTLTHRVRVDGRGIEGATSEERVFVAWPLLWKLIERRTCFYVMTGRSTAIILPKAALADEKGARLLEMIRRAGPRSSEQSR